MSATSKLALARPRLAASARANSMAVADWSSPTVVNPRSARSRRRGRLTATGVQHLAVELALGDQGRDLGLRFADAPRRTHPGELGSLTAVSRFEHCVRHFAWCGHTSGISTWLICVNMLDMNSDTGGVLEEQPLGYLMYRVVAVLQPKVAAQLQPLGLTLPEFVCLRHAVHGPRSVQRGTRAPHQRLTAGDEQRAARTSGSRRRTQTRHRGLRTGASGRTDGRGSRIARNGPKPRCLPPRKRCSKGSTPSSDANSSDSWPMP